MIITGVPLPTACRSDLMTDPDYRSVIGLLREMTEFGVLVVDHESYLTRSLFNDVANWPDKHRLRALKVLARLKDRHRIVVLNEECRIDPARDPCVSTVALAAKVHPDFLLVPPHCGCDGHCRMQGRNCYPNDRVDSLREGFENVPAVRSSIEITSGAWSTEEFSQSIWRPAFQYTKNLVIIDKQIGRAIMKNLSGGQGSNAESEGMPNNFAVGLDWLVQELIRHRRLSSRGLVRIFTEGGNSASRVLIAKAKRILSEYANNGSDDRVKIEVHLKLSPPDVFPHDRYLFTDHCGIGIGRGFDLLNGWSKKASFPTVKNTGIYRLTDDARSTWMGVIRPLPEP